MSGGQIGAGRSGSSVRPGGNQVKGHHGQGQEKRKEGLHDLKVDLILSRKKNSMIFVLIKIQEILNRKC